MRAELQSILSTVSKLTPDDLPTLLGELEQVRASVLLRLTAPPAPAQSPDSLLSVSEAAPHLGMSQDYLYRHSEQFPFTRRMGRTLRFSTLGIDAYIQKDGLTARRQKR